MPPTPSNASSVHFPSRIDPTRRVAGSKFGVWGSVDTCVMSSENLTPPNLERVTTAAAVDAHLEHVRARLGETYRFRRRKDGPGIVRHVRNEVIACRTAEQQIEILDR